MEVQRTYRAAFEWVNPRWLLDFDFVESYVGNPYGDDPRRGRGAQPLERRGRRCGGGPRWAAHRLSRSQRRGCRQCRRRPAYGDQADGAARSEEHTSELQSLAYLVCRLL